jgi:hypothetical protein
MIEILFDIMSPRLLVLTELILMVEKKFEKRLEIILGNSQVLRRIE